MAAPTRYEGQTLRISDVLSLDEDSNAFVRNHEFIRCELIGPAVLVFAEAVSFRRNGLRRDQLREVDDNRPYGGAVALEHCTVVECTFKGIGIAAPAELLDSFGDWRWLREEGETPTPPPPQQQFSGALAGSLMPIVDEMVRASRSGLEFVALAVSLTLPDICAALEAPNGQASGARYKAWLKEALRTVREEDCGPAGGPPKNETDLIYKLRCSFLHQENVQHPKSDTTIKLVPGNNSSVVHAGFHYEQDKLVDAIYSIPDFVIDIANAWTGGRHAVRRPRRRGARDRRRHLRRRWSRRGA